MKQRITFAGMALTLALTMMLGATRLLAQQAAQQAPAREFTVNPNYGPAQRLSLQLEIQLEDARNNPPRKSYRTPISLRVMRKSTAGTQLEWLAGAGSREGAAPSQDPIFEMAGKIFADLKLQVQLEPTGKYLGLRNESELKARIEQFLDQLIPEATAKISDAANRARAAESIKAALAPQVLLSAARKELDLFFGISGLRLEPGRLVRVKSGLLNPFGVTGTLDGEMQIVAEPVNAALHEVRVTFSQQYDPSGPSQTLSYTSGNAAPPSETPGSLGGPPKMSLEDSGEFVLDTRNWQVKQVRHMRTIRQNKEAVRTETTVITVQ